MAPIASGAFLFSEMKNIVNSIHHFHVNRISNIVPGRVVSVFVCAVNAHDTGNIHGIREYPIGVNFYSTIDFRFLVQVAS